MKKPAWSFSALSSFETCPRKHYRTRVIKDIVEPQGEAMLWGNEVHKCLEDRIKDGTPLPKNMQKWEGLVAKLLERKGTPIAEQQLCIDKTLAPTGWFDKDSWCRGIVDFTILDGDKALALDWKTGKVKTDHDQLKLFGALIFHHYPEVEKVTTGYVWLAHNNKITTKTFYRSDLTGIWRDYLPRVKRYEIAHKEDKWQPKPSGLCRGWCPVKDCEFNESKK
jgi:hypothetical protein